MEDILGPHPQKVLREALGFPKKKQMTDAQLQTHLVALVKKHPINGTNAMTLLTFYDTLLVLMGEIHENERLCRKPKYDVLPDILLKSLREHAGATLLVEGFLNSLSHDVPSLLGEIQQHPRLITCLRKNTWKCQYYDQDGTLLFLRVLKLVLHTSRLLYPRDTFVKHMEERIVYFDPRKDLGLQSPFVSWSFLDKPTYIRESLANFLNIHKFLPPLPDAQWQLAFSQKILKPMLAKAQRLLAKPCMETYTRFFIDIPDVVAVHRILVSIIKKPGTPILLYGGENHRHNVLELLQKLGNPHILAESKDPKDGSCSYPFSTIKSSAASRFCLRNFPNP